MSDLVERVAQEVCNVLTRGRRYDMLAIEVWADLDDLQREVWLRLVRHIIAAMREPTADMVWHAGAADGTQEIWQAMIDAALEKGK